MSEIDTLTRMLRQSVEGSPYYSPSVLKALEAITAEMAINRPAGSPHRIWDIVAHLTAELEYAREAIEGTAGPWSSTLTWPEVVDTSPAAWERAIRDLRAASRALERIIRGLDGATLDGRPTRVRGPYRIMLHGTIQHNAYHAGQISLLVGQVTAVRREERLAAPA